MGKSEGVGPVKTCRPTQVLPRTWRMPNVDKWCDSESQHTPELDGLDGKGYDTIHEGAAIDGDVLEMPEETAGLEGNGLKTTKGLDTVHLSGLKWTSIGGHWTPPSMSGRSS